MKLAFATPRDLARQVMSTSDSGAGVSVGLVQGSEFVGLRKMKGRRPMRLVFRRLAACSLSARDEQRAREGN